MKYFPLIAFATLVVAGVIWATLAKPASPAITMRATDASAQWPTYTSEELGIHIKYPPDSWWGAIQRTNSVSFSGPPNGALGITITRLGKLPNPEIARLFTSPQVSGRLDGTKINGIEAKHANTIVGSFGGGSMNVESFFLKGNGFVYQISVTAGWTTDEKKLKESPVSQPALREMLGTFGFNEINHSAMLTYVDPTYHYSFVYPADWELHFGRMEPPVSLHSMKPGMNHWIAFTVTPNMAVTEPIRRNDGFATEIGEKREYFAHKLSGRKYIRNGSEGYYFEKDGNLYNIHIFRIEGERKPVDDILDSFRP